MFVTIVIPTYNVERYIQETLESLSGQSYTYWEAIVVDDGSTDRTPEIVEKYSDDRIRLIRQSNQGGAAAREAGFAARSSKSESVLFFDHDDRLRRTGLALLVHRLQPGYEASHGLAAYMDEAGKPLKPGKYEAYLRNRISISERTPPTGAVRRLLPSEPTTFRSIVIRNLIPLGAILIRNTAKEAVGPFDPSFGYSHDWEMWLRLATCGPIAFENHVIYDYRVHSGSMSLTSDRFSQDDALVWNKYIHSKEFTLEQRQVALAGFDYFQREQLRKKGLKAFRRILRGRVGESRQIWQDARAKARRFSKADLDSQ